MKKLAGLLAIPLLVACASGSASPGESERTSPSADIATPSPTTEGPAGAGDLPNGLIDDVIALAEEETGVDRSEIEVVVAEAVTWSDGSIGCPEEGMAYTQALVPGYRVILDVDGEELAFHASEQADFQPCSSPIEPVGDGTVDR